MRTNRGGSRAEWPRPRRCRCATNARSSRGSGDVHTDTEQTNAALPNDKMVISSHLTVTKHFLFHSSVLLSNKSQAAAALSQQTLRSTVTSLGAGTEASLPGHPVEGESASRQPLQWDCAAADGGMAHLPCTPTKGRVIPGATPPQRISTPQTDTHARLGHDLHGHHQCNSGRFSKHLGFVSRVSPAD